MTDRHPFFCDCSACLNGGAGVPLSKLKPRVEAKPAADRSWLRYARQSEFFREKRRDRAAGAAE